MTAELANELWQRDENRSAAACAAEPAELVDADWQTAFE